MAEQDKRPPTQKPVLLSKDIETKLSLLDREVNYLLNKAKFAKPKTKAKKGSDKSSKASNDTTEETLTTPPEESTSEKSGGWSHAAVGA